MKICVAQTRPVKGDIKANMEHHKKLVSLAVNKGSGIIIFPELSLTGYEPELAAELATTPDDSRLADLQQLSDDDNITIGVGIPTKHEHGTCISMIIFQPQKEVISYSKKHLHTDEHPFFTSGENISLLPGYTPGVALAICYEISVPEHSEHAYKNGASIYIASVAKSASGVEKAVEQLANIAKKYSMTVLMSNFIGQCEDYQCGGKTSIWNNEGMLTAQLDDATEGILIIDTDTGETSKIIG